MIHPHFEEELRRWLLNAILTLQTPAGHSILNAIRQRLPHRSQRESFAREIAAEIRECDPLLPDARIKQSLLNRFYHADVRPRSGIYRDCLAFLLDQTIKAIYDNGWHARQWFPTSRVTHVNATQSSSKREDDAQNTTSAISSSEVKKSTNRLLCLPGEIRNEIWRFAVLPDTSLQTDGVEHVPVVILNGQNTLADGSNTKLASPPPLMSTCNQIREEVLPIYYAETTLSIALDTPDSYHAAHSWLEALSPNGLRHMRGIVLQGLIIQDRSPINMGGFLVHCMRVYIDFTSLTAYLEKAAPAIDQSKEMTVMKRTLADLRPSWIEAEGMMKLHLQVLIENFAKCCATLSDEAAVPLLAKGSQWDKIEARVEQQHFIDAYCRSVGEAPHEEDRLDLGMTRFSIW